MRSAQKKIVFINKTSHSEAEFSFSFVLWKSFKQTETEYVTKPMIACLICRKVGFIYFEVLVLKMYVQNIDFRKQRIVIIIIKSLHPQKAAI